MATTNHTPNYNFPQWLASDKVGIMANLNPAFSTIDEKLHEAIVNAENAATSSSAANQVATDASNLANKATNDVTALQTDILTLQNLVNAMNQSLTNAKNWTNVQITNNSDIITANNLECISRNDKQFMSIYGFVTMKKIKFAGGETLFTLQSNIPKTTRDISIFGLIRYSIGSDSVDIPARCRINNNGNIVIVNPYDFSNSGTSPTMFCQLLLNTYDWYD